MLLRTWQVGISLLQITYLAKKPGEQRGKARGSRIEPVVPTDREGAERARQGLGKEATGGFMSERLLPSVSATSSQMA